MNRLHSLFLVTLFLFALGCGRSAGPSYGGDDGKNIAKLVDQLIDDRTNPQRMATLFAKGSAPNAEQRRKFAPYAFEVVGNPKIDGATATATIQVVKDTDREKVGQKDWTFVKEGSAWKIKDAPLP